MSRILVIDDDAIVQDALEAFLSSEGHKVLSAMDGPGGILSFKRSHPDLVILDRDLPALSGSLVFDKIKEISENTPIIILTAYDNPDDIKKYIKNGAAAFISKTDGLLNVLEEVRKILGPAAGDKKNRPAGKIPPQTQAKNQKKTPKNTANAAETEKPKILIVDDDENLLTMLTDFLQYRGYETATAQSGAKALQCIEKEIPDIVLLDIYMPTEDGVIVLKNLRKKYPKLTVIMLSCTTNENLARECLKLGAVDYIPKPPNLNTLEMNLKGRWLLRKN